MATLTYTFVRRCSGGGHTTLGVKVNAGATQEITYDTDVVRQPLSALTQEEQEMFKLLVLKVHMAGKTRAQIVAEFQLGPVVITI